MITMTNNCAPSNPLYTVRVFYFNKAHASTEYVKGGAKEVSESAPTTAADIVKEGP
jgi:hypothetical protein